MEECRVREHIYIIGRRRPDDKPSYFPKRSPIVIVTMLQSAEKRRKSTSTPDWVGDVERGIEKKSRSTSTTISSVVRELDEPLDDRIEIRLFFGADSIARDLAVADALEVHGVDQLVHRELIWEVRFVSEDQERNAL